MLFYGEALPRKSVRLKAQPVRSDAHGFKGEELCLFAAQQVNPVNPVNNVIPIHQISSLPA